MSSIEISRSALAIIRRFSFSSVKPIKQNERGSLKFERTARKTSHQRSIAMLGWISRKTIPLFLLTGLQYYCALCTVLLFVNHQIRDLFFFRQHSHPSHSNRSIAWLRRCSAFLFSHSFFLPCIHFSWEQFLPQAGSVVRVFFGERYYSN